MATDLGSFFTQAGLSVTVSDPLVAASRLEVSTITETLSSYSHQMRATGGFYAASIASFIGLGEANDWISRGVGRHIEVMSPGLSTVWEGFVNKLTINLGRAKIVIGPLVSIGNKVKVAYSTVDTSTSPPTVGKRDTTAWIENSFSQAEHGVWQKVASISGSNATEALQVANTWLVEHAWPESGRRATLRAGSEPQVSLDCLGYWAWLEAYIYNQTASSGNIDLDDKIVAVLAADPNGIFSSDYTRIAANTTQISQYENKDKRAWTILKDLASKGDSQYRRYTLGVYEGRRLVYQLAPNAIELKTSLTENEEWSTLQQQRVEPWLVRPDSWVFLGDIQVGTALPATSAKLRSDVRAGFIESLKFSAPRDLEVDGQKVSHLDQQLARMGLAGAGV